MSGLINVSEALKNPGQAYGFERALDIPEMEFMSDPVRFENVLAHGTFVGADDCVNVACELDAVAVSRCARCLGEAKLNLGFSFEALYSREAEPDDPDRYRFEGYSINIEGAVQEQLVLRLPMRFLCRDDCAGICDKCGANLNEQTCTCRETVDETSPFAALKDIAYNDEEV